MAPLSGVYSWKLHLYAGTSMLLPALGTQGAAQALWLCPRHTLGSSRPVLTSLVVRLLCASRLRMASVLMARCGKKRSLTCSGGEVRPTQPWERSPASQGARLNTCCAEPLHTWCRRQGSGSSLAAWNWDLELAAALCTSISPLVKWGRWYLGALLVLTPQDSSRHMTCSPQPLGGVVRHPSFEGKASREMKGLAQNHAAGRWLIPTRVLRSHPPLAPPAAICPHFLKIPRFSSSSSKTANTLPLPSLVT